MTDSAKKSPPDFPHLHDIGLFYDRLHQAAARLNGMRDYRLEVLGQVEGYDLLLLSPAVQEDGKLSLLSAGGFHGEEPAGVWGILEYLETATEAEICGVNHSFLPLVNPTGFAAGTRLNIFGENPNRSFVPEKITDNSADIYTNRTEPSVEGKILLAHIDRLVALARDGFVTQHEDDGLHEGFIFLNEAVEQPSRFAKIFLDCLAEHVGIIRDGGADTLIDPKLQNGIWHNDFDASFEGLMTLKGIPRVVTTETPCLKPARARIDCNRDMIRAFAAFRP